ncbi:hypothetical protein VOLCADRAFT_99761 [Volvox carteri f. nagariensis]|uniref:Uncharacterized protein n=1 Tax=Volvox carteri f. nagariensis TaxID=3068 RepID=D8UIK8_VOLCA|nr:uncharacterized protein VOLCADRAFT_99761 [Volvox carteri f. nagariensis]EFJ40412.1 hypothetical protein VOLCADRAFT_99761 [Volvox carteri f. nagariensis]|eukprot:XP_002958492.1 hypothetical protein VOLCADRAFT_99761 [Volvox carteri f. nagariensis]
MQPCPVDREHRTKCFRRSDGRCTQANPWIEFLASHKGARDGGIRDMGAKYRDPVMSRQQGHVRKAAPRKPRSDAAAVPRPRPWPREKEQQKKQTDNEKEQQKLREQRQKEREQRQKEREQQQKEREQRHKEQEQTPLRNTARLPRSSPEGSADAPPPSPNKRAHQPMQHIKQAGSVEALVCAREGITVHHATPRMYSMPHPKVVTNTLEHVLTLQTICTQSMWNMYNNQALITELVRIDDYVAQVRNGQPAQDVLTNVPVSAEILGPAADEYRAALTVAASGGRQDVGYIPAGMAMLLGLLLGLKVHLYTAVGGAMADDLEGTVFVSHYQVMYHTVAGSHGQALGHYVLLVTAGNTAAWPMGDSYIPHYMQPVSPGTRNRVGVLGYLDRAAPSTCCMRAVCRLPNQMRQGGLRQGSGMRALPPAFHLNDAECNVGRGALLVVPQWSMLPPDVAFPLKCWHKVRLLTGTAPPLINREDITMLEFEDVDVNDVWFMGPYDDCNRYAWILEDSMVQQLRNSSTVSINHHIQVPIASLCVLSGRGDISADLHNTLQTRCLNPCHVLRNMLPALGDRDILLLRQILKLAFYIGWVLDGVVGGLLAALQAVLRHCESVLTPPTLQMFKTLMPLQRVDPRTRGFATMPPGRNNMLQMRIEACARGEACTAMANAVIIKSSFAYMSIVLGAFMQGVDPQLVAAKV